MSGLRMRVTAGRAATDPEKMVLPGLVFCKSKQADASGFAIALGWWDYHVTLMASWPTTANTNLGEQG